MSLKRKRDMNQIFRSRTITFIIGKDRTEYTGHESAFLAMSQSFKDFIRRKIRTSFKLASINQVGSVSYCVDWEDIEPASFVNLMEYAYSGDYTVPALSKSKTEDTFNTVKGGHSSHDTPGTKCDDGDVNANIPASIRPSTAKRLVPLRLGMGPTRTRRNAPQPEISSLYTWIRNVSQDPQCQQHTSAQYKFCEEHFPIPFEATESTTEDWLEDIKLQHQTGYKEVFLAHAKLYLTADQFEIIELKRLCLHKLRQSLLHAPGTDEMLRATTDTIRHIYSNTTSRDDDLRKLLLQFCLTDMEWMMRDKDLEPVLESVPGFAIDLFREIPHDYWREIRDGGAACEE
ncbi:hypothetical protein CMEL01_08974 [Colletotrichum melonis]|uniref:BTB domain-containing protein n=1 Tax=Colletotrichum melonis TaxID=1209925 RepID=A0AAI9XG60_9PEZI|nr:hypothetical protein CMEL01_08974 [Colletotrichum melonis]